MEDPLECLSGAMNAFCGSSEAAEVAVIVVTFRSAKDLPALIDSLRAEAQHTAMRVIVADNRSDDGTLELARAHPDVIALDTGGNLGYAAGINRAMAHAGNTPAVLVLNPDSGSSPVAFAPCCAAWAGTWVSWCPPSAPRAESLHIRSATSLDCSVRWRMPCWVAAGRHAQSGSRSSFATIGLTVLHGVSTGRPVPRCWSHGRCGMSWGSGTSSSSFTRRRPTSS